VNQYIIEKIIGHYMETKTVGRYSRGLTLEDLREAYKMANWSLEIDEAKVQELEGRLKDTERTLGTEVVSRTQELEELRQTVERQGEWILELMKRLK